MERDEFTLAMPDIGTYRYKDNVKQIEELVRGLNDFTFNFQGKVNTMLKGQETEFVNSYKQHMFKIEGALKQYQKRIEDYQKKIQHYQNQGMLAILLKKIQFLQNNQRKLLDSHQKKDKTIGFLKGEITTQQRQILSLQAKIKQLMLAAPVAKIQKHEDPTFATEVNGNFKNTLKSSHSIEYVRNNSPKYLTITNPQNSGDKSFQNSQIQRVNRQLSTLKKKHRQLSSVNSKIIEKASSIEQFFLKVVNDLKRKISGRKRFSECRFEDFKQEDKLQLLVKVLSNQDILQHLYYKIFNRTGRIQAEKSKWENQEVSFEKEVKIGRSERVVSRLPVISGRRP